MCGGGGGSKTTEPVGNLPELTEKQLSNAVTLPNGFTAKPVAGRGNEPGAYVIYDPSGDVYSSTPDFGQFIAAANQVNQLSGASNSLYNPETNTFVDSRTGQSLSTPTPNAAGLSGRGTIGGMEIATPGAEDDVAGITELAYGLASQGLTLPEQKLAALTPDQLAAFDLARAGIGSYQPYLDRATGLTDEGITSLQQARQATLDLAGQIPGEVQTGQAALQQAAAQVLRAAQSSDKPTQLAARKLMASSDRIGQLAARTEERLLSQGVKAEDIASTASANARALQAPLESTLYQTTGGARGFAQQGISQLSGTGAMFDPRMANAFMSEYENAAVDAALSDIARQGLLQEQDLAARAVQSGAYGGSREAVARAELGRNVLEQQAKTAAQLRATGYESAAQRAQQAFEQSQARQQSRAQLTGQLGMSGEQFAAANAQALAQTGLNIEQLAAQTGISAEQLVGDFAAQAAQTGLSAESQRQSAAAQQAQLAQAQAALGMQGAQAAGGLGLQSANLGLAGIGAGLSAQQQAAGMGQGIAGLGQQYLGLGQAGQQFNLQDINTMLNIGQIQQRQQQAEYDTDYGNQYRQMMQPYQQLAFLSDIVGGAPSGQASTMTQPGPSFGSQMLGLGMTIPYIYQGWQGMTQ